MQSYGNFWCQRFHYFHIKYMIDCLIILSVFANIVISILPGNIQGHFSEIHENLTSFYLLRLHHLSS